MGIKSERLAYFNITTACTSVTFSGLDGDTDEEYEIRGLFVCGSGTGPYYIIRPNNDSGNNYGEQFFTGYATTIEANRYTPTNGIYISDFRTLPGCISKAVFNLFAKSGFVRTALGKVANSITTTTVGHAWLTGQSWNNIADNITSLVVLATETNGIGVGSVIELYRKVTV
mgnify:CR=1 FL=1